MIKDFYKTAVKMILKHKHKFPRLLFVLYVFIVFFQGIAITIHATLVERLTLILPNTFLNFLHNLQLSTEEFWTVWAGLLWLFLISILLETLSLILMKKKAADDPMEPGSGSSMLLLLNVYVLLFSLIYLKLTNQRLLCFIFENLWNVPVLTLALVPLAFICIFAMNAYFIEIYLIYYRINQSEKIPSVAKKCIYASVLIFISIFLLK